MKTKPPIKPATKPTANSAEEQRILDHIQKRAYELWEAGGCQHGSDTTHWMQAEREIRAQRSSRAN